MLSLLPLLLLLLSLPLTQPLAPSAFSRRSILPSLAAAPLSLLLPPPSNALSLPSVPPPRDTASGTVLPPSAASFSSLVKGRSDLPSLVESLTSTSVTPNVPLEPQQWQQLQLALRPLYQLSFAMASSAPPGKRDAAKPLIDRYQALLKKADVPCRRSERTVADVEAVRDLLKEAGGVMEEFFELLRDVPDL